MRRFLMPFIVLVVLLLSVDAGLAQVHITECVNPGQRNCCANSQCCTTEPIDCGPEGSCSCNYSCGSKSTLCGCSCGNEGGSASATESGGARGVADRVTLTADGATLQEIAETVERVTKWRLQVPLESLRVPLYGKWKGTFEEVLTAFAREQGLRPIVDTGSRRVALVPMD